MTDTRQEREMPPGIGLPAADDIFTDNVRFGDIDAWNRAAVRIHEEQGGFYRIEREGFPRILAVLDHAAVLEVERRTGFEARVTNLGHILRGGSPTAYDRVIATRFGIEAIDAVHEHDFGIMVALRGTDVVRVELSE